MMRSPIILKFDMVDSAGIIVKEYSMTNKNDCQQVYERVYVTNDLYRSNTIT